MLSSTVRISARISARILGRIFAPENASKSSSTRLASRGVSALLPSRWLVAGASLSVAVVTAVTAGLSSASASAVNVKGRISGSEKLAADVYLEAAKPDAKRWSWREPSPAVPQQFRALAPNVSREVCVVATNTGQNPPSATPILVRVTGGRTNPATLVVTPNTSLVFQNDDPFPHRLVVVGQTNWNGVMDPHAKREWKAPGGAGRIEFRDELFPSVRSFVVVDPHVVQSVYPARDNSFGLALPSGDYVIKVFFGGKQVGKDVGLTAKEKGTLEIKDAIALAEGQK